MDKDLNISFFSKLKTFSGKLFFSCNCYIKQIEELTSNIPLPNFIKKSIFEVIERKFFDKVIENTQFYDDFFHQGIIKSQQGQIPILVDNISPVVFIIFNHCQEKIDYKLKFIT